ncbi:ATP-binding protein [Pseudodesulfovibrio piezophilus]|uniref:histidine kinase n=1 Tax=Pseudodesulfovibrio piezophilus (strain DSM 21447 / JCM 15486 / C1TLV30) TaxID=1322246 RepID=M1WK53_PSEP2|nr:ATP-binding protein [Pseudodesulfovibrio piezophilus]CCH49001.1 Histidine kinase (modular protein) [Pseudodesulfovibrio piezophilus C1TLV30]
MHYLPSRLRELFREPQPPENLAEEFRRAIDLSNCRRLKAVTWLVLSSLTFLLIADYFTVKQAGHSSVWCGIVILRSVAILACFAFFPLFGPLRSVHDIKPRHHLVWKMYTYFFMIYTSAIVGYMFPLKDSIGPMYVFLLGPSAFLAMPVRQVSLLIGIGWISLIGALFLFVPELSLVKHHLINAMVISWVSFAVAHIGYRAAYRDFMNRKVIEGKNRQLREAHAQVLDASRAKSDFLATVSHEIRTPMNSILGMTEVALQSGLQGELREYIETARESALHLLDVITDILDFSRIEARRLRLVSAHFDLSSVVNSAMRTVKLHAEKKGVALEFESLDGTPRFLKGDPVRLRQVLINLLNNAIKFTDDGYIRLTVSSWPEGGDDPDRPVGVRFSVKDSGTGIGREKIRTIFEAFTQGDGSSSRSHGGSGLGLSICKSLVDLMGGEIRVQSEKGVGSEFSFTSRFGEGNAERANEPEFVAAFSDTCIPVKRSNVLLVDDNPLNVKVEKLHLERLGMRTTVAESGAKALMLLAEHDFDIVLMDLEMPGMDGHETTRRIRSGEGLGRPVRQPTIPIVAITAHALGEIRSRCAREGMNGFVTKPVGCGDLGATMQQVLGGDWQAPEEQKRHEVESTPVLDLEQAASMLDITSEEMEYLLPNAISEVSLKFELAEKGVQAGLLQEVALQAHTLKSVAASIGAEMTRRAAVRLENSARQGDHELSRKRLATLRVAIARLEVAVKAH